MRDGKRQFAFYMIAATLVAFKELVRFVEGTQDFVFFLAVKANIFVDWHNAPFPLIIYQRQMNK
jgi:hypothetical protein